MIDVHILTWMTLSADDSDTVLVVHFVKDDDAIL